MEHSKKKIKIKKQKSPNTSVFAVNVKSSYIFKKAFIFCFVLFLRMIYILFIKGTPSLKIK